MLRLHPDVDGLRDAFARLRAELHVPEGFPSDVAAEADVAAHNGPALPPSVPIRPRVDARDVAFVTIDPRGSRDLDQAYYASRAGDGYVVQYAIADVACFVAPGGALDAETRRRGTTLYLPDGRAPLHPDVLGEGAASLLPDQDRPALLWTIPLDERGEPAGDARLERAEVRSREALDYPGVQRTIDTAHPSEPLALLAEIGTRRLAREAERGGMDIDLPNQEVIPAAHGGYDLAFEEPLAVESWNAQISLLTGMCAATIMVHAGVGLLRTLPPPPDWVIDRLRRTAHALHVDWSSKESYTDVIRRTHADTPDRAAFLVQAARTLRGAGYATVSPDGPAPEHAAVAAPYAHVTAPLRRLGDRFANEVVLAACGGYDVPDWALAALDGLPAVMDRALQHDHAVEHAAIDLVECAILSGRVGEEFTGVVVDRRHDEARVQITSPAIEATVATGARLGDEVRIRLTNVDVTTRKVEFAGP